MQIEKLNGSPSNETLVEFTAYQASPGNTVGTFSFNQVKTNLAGNSQVTFKTDQPGVDKSQPVIVVATIQRGSQMALQEQISLTVNQ